MMPMPLSKILEVAAEAAVDRLMSRTDHDKIGAGMCMGFAPDDTPILIAITGQMNGKAQAATTARDILMSNACDRYTFVMEAWFSPSVAASSGVPPRNAPDKQDGLYCIAATRDRALIRTYIIRRIDHVPGIELFKHSQIDSQTSGEGIGGRWAQLLAPHFDPTGVTGYFTSGGWQPGRPPALINRVI